MTTLATVEDMQAMEAGQHVTVARTHNNRNDVWQKLEDGSWRFGSFVLTTDMFAGDLAEGRVYRGIRPEAGQFWTNRNGWSYLLIERSEENWWALRYSGSSFSRLMSVEEAALGTLDERPAWAETALALGRSLLASNRTSMQRQEALTTLQRSSAEDATRRLGEFNEFRTKTERALHTLAKERPELEEALSSVLTELGLRRPEQVKQVTLSVYGSSYVRVPISTVLPHVSGSLEPRPDTDMVQVHLPWSKRLTAEVTVERGECGCGLVTRRQVQRLLEEAGVQADNFSTMAQHCGEGCNQRPLT